MSRHNLPNGVFRLHITEPGEPHTYEFSFSSEGATHIGSITYDMKEGKNIAITFRHDHIHIQTSGFEDVRDIEKAISHSDKSGIDGKSLANLMFWDDDEDSIDLDDEDSIDLDDDDDEVVIGGTKSRFDVEEKEPEPKQLPDLSPEDDVSAEATKKFEDYVKKVVNFFTSEAPTATRSKNLAMTMVWIYQAIREFRGATQQERSEDIKSLLLETHGQNKPIPEASLKETADSWGEAWLLGDERDIAEKTALTIAMAIFIKMDDMDGIDREKLFRSPSVRAAVRKMAGNALAELDYQDAREVVHFVRTKTIGVPCVSVTL